MTGRFGTAFVEPGQMCLKPFERAQRSGKPAVETSCTLKLIAIVLPQRCEKVED